jgi:gliding motility-associated-like protein
MAAFDVAHAQPPIQWENNLGGSKLDAGNAIEQTTDGGYVVAGEAGSSDGDVGGNQGINDYWIVKLDGSGKLVWENNLGGSNWDVASDIEQTSDGGYVVAGASQSNDGDVDGNQGRSDYWIVKLDSRGQLLWENNLGGFDIDRANDIEQTSDGGYVVAGLSRSDDGDVGGNQGEVDYWIVKLDSRGQLLWENNLGGSDGDRANDIEQTSDGGYVVAGWSRSSDRDVGGNQGFRDYWIVKLDSIGQLVWENNLGGSSRDLAYDIEQTTDGSYVVAGEADSANGDVGGNQGSLDYWIVKLNSSGELVWENNLGGSDIDWARNIEQTANGGYVVAGSSNSNDGDIGGTQGTFDFDYWIVKLDSLGQLIWEDNLGGSRFDKAFDIEQTSYGGYVVAGNSLSSDGDVGGNQGKDDRNDYWIVKLGTVSMELGPDTTLCGEADSVKLSANVAPGDNLTWSTGDTTSQITVREPGTYYATLNTGDTVVSDTVEVSQIPRPQVNLGPDKQTLCGEIDTTLTPETTGASTFRWNTGDTTRSLSVNAEGTYWLQVKNDQSCNNADTITLQSANQPEGFDANKQICCGEELQLNAGNPGASYQWNNGSTERTITVRSDGLYWVSIANANCTTRDSVQVRLGVDTVCPYVFVPNAFSPNGDRLNDVFRPRTDNISNYRLTIYNRWGARIFESNTPSEGWDGTYKDQPAPAGGYHYQLRYRIAKEGVEQIKTQEGTVRLIR